MATKKTLNQILRQNSFSGADVGKALILNTIERVTERKNTLSENELDTMINNLSNQKQRVIYKAYYILNQYLDDFYKLSQGNLQQYFNGRGSLANALDKVFTAQKGYRRYLHLPLVLTEKEYSKLRADAVKNYENKATDLYTIILFTIADYLTAYRDNKQLPENIKAILDSYKNEKIKIEFADEISETGQTASDSDFNKEKFIADSEQKIFANFANKYGIENTQEAISSFIANSFIAKLATEIEKNIPNEKILKKNSDKLLTCIELYEDANKRECNYLNKDYIDIYEQAKSWSETVTIEEMSKLEALDLLSEDFLEYYNFESRDKTTAELQQEFITEYTELYNATKDILSKGYKQLKTLKDSELLTVELTNKEQIKAGIIKPLTENELKDETREYFINLEPANTEDFIKIHKAQYGGIAVIKGESFYSYDKEILNEYSKAPFNTLLPEGLTPQLVDIYINNLIKPALIAIYGVNALLDVYSELFKVDLSPLKQEDIFTSQIEAYNGLVYLSYESIEGTTEQVESDRLTFKQIFKPINVNECKPTTEQIDALKRELEALPIIDTLKLDYFSQLLQGANVRYDK